MIIFTVTAVHLYACTDVHELQYKSTNSLSLSLYVCMYVCMYVYIYTYIHQARCLASVVPKIPGT